ncbi:MAG: hypothetical protein V3R73_05960 [Sphingomonadales bacterium]
MTGKIKLMVGRMAGIAVAAVFFFSVPDIHDAEAASCREEIPELGSIYCDARAGSKRAQYKVGKWYLGGPDHDPDYKQAMKWFKKASARARVGRGVNSGGAGGDYGPVHKDRVAGATLGKSGRHSGALYEMALLYLEGKGVKQSNKKAKKYMKLAAKEGNRQARRHLAELEKSE